MPKGPVKTKPLQICFMRVSIVSKRPQLTSHQLFYSGTRMWISVLQCFISEHVWLLQSTNVRHAGKQPGTKVANTNQTMTSAKMRFYCVFPLFFFKTLQCVLSLVGVCFKSCWTITSETLASVNLPQTTTRRVSQMRGNMSVVVCTVHSSAQV